jgi:hypothetical protein
MTDNADMSDVNFEDVSVGHRKCFRKQQNCQFVGERYGDDFGQRGNYRYWDHNTELGGGLGTIKLILTFQENNDPEVYLG